MKVDGERLGAQEMTEFRIDALDHRINRIDYAISSLDGIARKHVKHQQPRALIIVSTIRQLLVSLGRHHLVQNRRRRRNSFDGRLGGEDDGFATFQHDAFEPDVIADTKTGLSGAGRALGLNVHFSEADESVAPYGLDGHRHVPEMTQELGLLAEAPKPRRQTSC